MFWGVYEVEETSFSDWSSSSFVPKETNSGVAHGWVSVD